MRSSLLRGVAVGSVLAAGAAVACGVSVTGEAVTEGPDSGSTESSSGGSGNDGSSSGASGSSSSSGDAAADVISQQDGSDATVCAAETTAGCPCGVVCPSGVCSNGTACDPLVFITSGAWDGSLGGTAGVTEGDARCQAAGAGFKSAPKPAVFKAWLSADAEAAGTRLLATQRPFRMPNGVAIASNWAALVGGTPPVSITVTESKGSLTNAMVWTATAYDGSAYVDNCANWTAGGGMTTQGGYGINTAAGNLWSLTGSVSCDTLGHLYCLEQIP